MRLLTLLRTTLREIFDGRAYERYLVRTSALRNRASYRAYLDSKSATDNHKPRCC